MTCDNSITDGWWGCELACSDVLTFSLLVPDTVNSGRITYVNKSSLEASIICKSTKGIL